MDIMNFINHLNGPEYGYFLHVGLLDCPFHSDFILNDNLRTTVCLSDVKIDINLMRFMIFLLVGPFSYVSTHIQY